MTATLEQLKNAMINAAIEADAAKAKYDAETEFHARRAAFYDWKEDEKYAAQTKAAYEKAAKAAQ